MRMFARQQALRRSAGSAARYRAAHSARLRARPWQQGLDGAMLRTPKRLRPPQHRMQRLPHLTIQFVACAAPAIALAATSPAARAEPLDASPENGQARGAAARVPHGAAELGRELAVGDIVFIRVGAYPFRKVADATGSWTNHVGIVLDVSSAQPVIGESRFPLSASTTLSAFVARSAGGRVAVMRMPEPLSARQQAGIAAAAAQREHVLYDTGFDLHSRRQFCSRYVREVLQQGAGVEVGTVQDFRSLLAESPHPDVGFWRLWYFGHIPWQRETVTPASLLHTPGLRTVFDGTLG